jgi:hypothetical protein
MTTLKRLGVLLLIVVLTVIVLTILQRGLQLCCRCPITPPCQPKPWCTCCSCTYQGRLDSFDPETGRATVTDVKGGRHTFLVDPKEWKNPNPGPIEFTIKQGRTIVGAEPRKE